MSNKIDELVALHKKTTQGEWEVGEHWNSVRKRVWVGDKSIVIASNDNEDNAIRDADFIAAAHNLLPAIAAEFAALQAQRDALKQEAQIQAQEARTQKSIVLEIYQIVTGKTGEPGDWNGARPVAELVRNLQSRLELRQNDETRKPK